MSQFSSFDGLPLIVHDRILRSLASPKDVANTISASPASLHTFMTGRRSILLSAMRNFLSLENQHLMNLVMAAPHFFGHRQVNPERCASRALVSNSDNNSTTSIFQGFGDVAEFDLALYEVFHKCNLRPLTLNTFDCSIKLYATMDKVTTDYSPFTIARSQHRVPMLSTPEACRSRYKHVPHGHRTPDDEETSRLWRGFLLYELLCFMHGVPRITAAATGESYHTPKELLGALEFFERMPRPMQEEVMCVQHYVREQYDLAFNALVESLELAVGELGRRASEISLPLTDDTIPIIELEDGVFESPVQYLFESSSANYNPWKIKLAMLGVSFLQRFLSWDASTRLDFTRITYPFLASGTGCRIRDIFRCSIDMGDFIEEEFGWSNDHIDQLLMYEELEFPSKARLRAVGWIFWKNTERLLLMNLNEDDLVECYGSEGRIRTNLRLQGRPHLMETSVQPHDWERICQYFGPSFSDDELNHTKDLFTSTASLKSSHIADVVRILRCQDVGVSPTEAKESGI